MTNKSHDWHIWLYIISWIWNSVGRTLLEERGFPNASHLLQPFMPAENLILGVEEPFSAAGEDEPERGEFAKIVPLVKAPIIKVLLGANPLQIY